MSNFTIFQKQMSASDLNNPIEETSQQIFSINEKYMLTIEKKYIFKFARICIRPVQKIFHVQIRVLKGSYTIYEI